MPTIYRTRSGMLLHDDFGISSLDPAWRIEPESETSRVSVDARPGWLQLRHGGTPVFVLRPIPLEPNLVIEAQTDYDPSTVGDLGGLVLFRSSDDWAGITEYFDPNTTVTGWSYLRLVRTNMSRWDAYASHDGTTWDWLGAQLFSDAADFGFVLNGESGDTLDIDVVRVYRSTKITVQGLTTRWIVRLLDSSGTPLKEATVPDGASSVQLDVSDVIFPLAGYIRVYDSSGVMVRDSGLIPDIWGGDEYRAEVMISLYDDAGNPIPLDREWDFGEIRGLQHARKIEVRNDTEFSLTDVSVSVIPDPGGTFGDAWVDVAPDVGGAPGTYGDVVTIASIPSGASRFIWVRVTRGMDGPPLDRYKFGLRITIP